jgi:hypothetical protein
MLNNESNGDYSTIVNTDNNNSRANYNRIDTLSDTTLSDTKESENNYNKINKFENTNDINIYRYKFTNEFTSELFTFSKIHQYDHRKDFKEAWKIWLEENESIVDDEVRRLHNFNYEGNVQEKMFKSARYYFRKKSTEKKEPTERRIYVSVQKDLLDAIDEHINSQIKNKNYKPSQGFDEFCKNNIELLKNEVNILCKNGLTDSNEIKKKIKKTYKNRYFLIIKK